MEAVSLRTSLHGPCTPQGQRQHAFSTKSLRRSHPHEQSAAHGLRSLACGALSAACLRQRKSRAQVLVMHQQMPRTEEASEAVKRLSPLNVPDTTIVTSAEEADKVMDKLLNLKDSVHAIDTEVRGWDPDLSPHLHGEIICWSIYCGDDVDFGNGPRLFIDNLDEDGQLRGLVEHFKRYLEDPEIPKVFQNYSFDRAMFLKHGCDVAGFFADTMNLARLDNSDANSYSLEELGKRYLGDCWGKRSLSQFMKEEKAKSVAELHLHKDPNVRAQWMDYSTFDTLVTWKLHQVLWDRLGRTRPTAPVAGQPTVGLLEFYERFWRPFAEVLCHIEERGLRVDRDFLCKQLKVAEDDLRKEREAFMNFIHQQWERLYPNNEQLLESFECFNPNSTHQMRQLLYGKDVQVVAGVAIGGLRLPKVKVAKKEESTSTEAIEKLAGKDPAAGESGCGLAFKKLGQEGCMGLRSRIRESQVGKAITFLTKFSDDQLADGEGRVHTSLGIDTRTGRLSSRKPNLHQVPAVNKDYYQIRSSIIPAPGKSFIIADYGQLDLRVLAHTCGCPNLVNALSTGIDLHSHTAVQMYPYLQEAIDAGEISLEDGHERPSLKDVYPSERRAAKAVNFGIAYGLTSRGLAEQLRCSPSEATDMIDKWHAAYPQVEKWQRQNVATAERGDLTVRTFRGRPRHLFNLSKKTIEKSYQKRQNSLAYGKRTKENEKKWQPRSPEDTKRWREYYAAIRQANNSPVQGGSADLVAEAMVKAELDLELKKLGYVMVLQVHDELIFEGPEEHEQQALLAVKRIMEDPFLDDYKFLVPLVVDAKVAKSWHEAKHA